MNILIGGSVVISLIAAFVILAFARGWIGSFSIKEKTRAWLTYGVLIYAVIAMSTGGWLTFATGTSVTDDVSVIDAEYDVAVTESHSHVSVNDATNTITVMLDRNETAWESATQYANLTFTCTRTDAGTADSTVVFDVSQVDSWIETDGTTRTALAKYSNGEYYADWSEYGTTATVNDKISMLIDRETESNAVGNISMIACLSSWLLESAGETHSVILTLTDVGSDWSESWTVTYFLQNTS